MFHELNATSIYPSYSLSPAATTVREGEVAVKDMAIFHRSRGRRMVLFGLLSKKKNQLEDDNRQTKRMPRGNRRNRVNKMNVARNERDSNDNSLTSQSTPK